MEAKIFYKTTLRVVVLSEGAPISETDELETVAYQLADGDCIGSMSITKVESLTADQVAEEEKAVGGDGTFFKILDDTTEDARVDDA